MRMERFQAETPEAKNLVKVRITAGSRDDAVKATETLTKGWTHHMIKQIRQAARPDRKRPGQIVYHVLLWNEPEV